MARIRSVKPSLRTSQVVALWPFEVRYFWVLLWGYLDDKGRGLDIPKTIAGDCFPRDDRITATVVNKWLTLMSTTKAEPGRDPPVCRYEVAGVRYVHSVYWDEHQKPNRPSPSMHAPCPIHEQLTAPLTESNSEPISEPPLSRHVLEFEGLTEGELEGSPREPLTEPPVPLSQEPPRQCAEHANDPDPPSCGKCMAARRSFERWEREQLRAAAKLRSTEAKARAEATATAIRRCRLCDDHGYRGSLVCDHDPTTSTRAKRGASEARAALERKAVA